MTDDREPGSFKPPQSLILGRFLQQCLKRQPGRERPENQVRVIRRRRESRMRADDIRIAKSHWGEVYNASSGRVTITRPRPVAEKLGLRASHVRLRSRVNRVISGQTDQLCRLIHMATE